MALKSLEIVLEKYLRLAEQRTEEAQKKSIENVEEIDDLDVAIVSPERFDDNLPFNNRFYKTFFSMLLSVVSGAVAQDRMDRTILSPW